MKKILFLLAALIPFSGIVHADITWSAPAAISTALTNASDPQVVIDTSGNTTAIWVESNAIKASSLPSGGSWSTPVTLSSTTSSSPNLKVDSAGNVTALWIEGTQIVSAILPSGGSWGSSSVISGTNATAPVLAVDSSGNAVSVWVRGTFVETSTRVSGIWSLVSVLSTANSSNPHVAINNTGNAIAAWHNTNGSGADQITTSILTINTNTWATSINVFSLSAAFSHNYPKVGLDSFGNAYIAWFRYTLSGGAYQNVQVLASTLTAGASAWAILPDFLSEPGIRNPADLTLKLRVDTSGDVLVLWSNSYDGFTFNIESSCRRFGAPSWPEFVTPEVPSLYSFGLDVAVANGTALLTNMAWDGVSTLFIQSEESDMTDPIAQAWSVSNPFSTGDDNGYPKCSLSSSGSTFNAAAVWIHYDGSNNVIHAATGTSTLIDPPSSVTASQSSTSFGFYTDYYNTITWSASSDPNVMLYVIYRNGVFFAQTTPDVLEFVDHNTAQGGTVIYGVAALNTSYRQSEIIYYTLNP